MTKSMVNEISFPEPNILPADDIRRGGIPEKPIPVSPIPMKLTICELTKIAHDSPARLINERMMRSVPAFILELKKLITSRPTSIPILNN